MNTNGQVYVDYFGDAPSQDIERFRQALDDEVKGEIERSLQEKAHQMAKDYSRGLAP